MLRRKIWTSATLKRAEIAYSQAESDMRWSGFEARGRTGYVGMTIVEGMLFDAAGDDTDDLGRSARADAAMMRDASPESVSRWLAARAEVDRLSAMRSHCKWENVP